MLIQAVELDPNSLASIVAAGLALHDASRNVEAEIYFRRAVHLDPTVIKYFHMQIILTCIREKRGPILVPGHQA